MMGAKAGEGFHRRYVSIDGVAGDGGACPADLARSARADVLTEELERLGVVHGGLDVAGVCQGREGAT